MKFDLRLYYFAMSFGVVLGTWVSDWLFALVIMNFGMAAIIMETIFEKKYGRRN